LVKSEYQNTTQIATANPRGITIQLIYTFLINNSLIKIHCQYKRNIPNYYTATNLHNDDAYTFKISCKSENTPFTWSYFPRAKHSIFTCACVTITNQYTSYKNINQLQLGRSKHKVFISFVIIIEDRWGKYGINKCIQVLILI